MASLEDKLERFRDHLNGANLIDYSVHYSFKAEPHRHGYKADFEQAAPAGSRLFDEWVDTTTSFIDQNYKQRFEIVVGIANETNLLAKRVAYKIGGLVIAVETYKPQHRPTMISLDSWEQEIIRTLNTDSALILEDVGNTGSTSGRVADILHDNGVTNVEVLNTLQRSLTLPELDRREVPYKSLYVEDMPMYSPQDCTEFGLCSQGIRLVRHA